MRIVNWAAMTFMVLSILVAAVRSDDQGISAAPAQSAATPAKQPSPVTLAKLKLILKYKLDGQWEAGTYLEGLVDLGPNARGARNTLYLIFPWPGDVKGIARAKKVTESWNRPTEVVWTSEHWVVIGDGMTAREDAEVSAATKRLTKLLKDLALKVLPPDTAAQASSKPGADGAAAEPAISVELGFRKKPPVFAVNESIVVEARFVNRTDKPQVYRGGLGDKNIKHSCQIKLMAEGGKAWSARAAAAALFANYKDIEVPPRGQTVIGEWDLSKLLYSEGSRWSAGGKTPFADIARPGKYRVCWWDGVFQLGTPLRSESAGFAIGKSDNAVGVTGPGVAPEAFDGEKLLAEIKKLVATEDWKAAHELLKKHPGHHATPAGVEWNYLSSYLQDAATYPDDNKSQKRGRAKAAEMLGLYDLAMKQYELQLTLAEDNQGRYEARHGKAMSAWWAAIDAVAGGQHQRAVALLDVMRDSGDTWVKEAGQAKGELVRKLAAAPESVDLRIEFAQKFWGENVPALGKHDQHARKLLIDTLKLNPSAKQKLQLCRLIQSYSQQLGDATAAEQYAERIIKACSTEDKPFKQATISTSARGPAPTDKPRTLFEDEEFRFVEVDFGHHEQPQTPGFYAFAKRNSAWARIDKVSTKGGVFGRSPTDDELRRTGQREPSVAWDFRRRKADDFVKIPLQGGSFIAFPDKVVFDVERKQYVLSFHSSWGIEAVTTVLRFAQSDLRAAIEQRRNGAAAESSSDEPLPNTDPGLRWIDGKSERTLFTAKDITRFDWQRQVFELTRERAMDLEAVLPPHMGQWREFEVCDGGKLLYRGRFINPESSIGFGGPTIVYQNQKPVPPLLAVQSGYPTGTNDDQPHLTGETKAAFERAGVLAKIPEDEKPQPISRLSTEWVGQRDLVKVRVEVFPRHFALASLLGVHVFFASDVNKTLPFEVINIYTTVVGGDGKFFCHTDHAFPTPKDWSDFWQRGVKVLRWKPWGSVYGAEQAEATPGPAEVKVKVVLRDRAGKSLAECDLPRQTITILPKMSLRERKDKP